MSAGPLTIDVYSDVICPWCYVGKRRLERALASDRGDIRVIWRPFQLNPTMPLEGMERTAYLQAKFGSRDAYRQLEEQVSEAEPQLGFAFDKITVTPNTFAAHRLIRRADSCGKQDATVEALFHCYFVEGKDIGRIETLVEIAARAGLNPREMEAFLKSDDGVENVKAEETEGHRLGIRSVPHFVLNGVFAFSGAQPPEVLAAGIATVRAAEETRATSRR